MRLKLAWAGILSTLVCLALVAAGPARAHEVRPAIADVTVAADRVVLEIRLTLEALVAGIDLQGLDDTDNAPQADEYDRLRALDPAAFTAAVRAAWPRLSPGFRLAAGDTPLTPVITDLRVPEIGNTDLPRDSVMTVLAPLPPDGTPVTVGWTAAYGPLVVRQTGDAETAYTGYLTNGRISDPLPRTGVAEQGAWAAFGTYVVIGFRHIVPRGLDHILFVLGLFFFSLKLRPLLYQVTAFTVAHTVTLALAALGLVTVPAAIVEPLIAASIVYVAVENVFFTKITAWRTFVVFGFGLLHGLGFASVLGEIGLDPARFVAGLIAFNIGVELGQLAVIAGAFLFLGYWFGREPWWRARIAIPASLAIAAMGAYWLVERTLL